MADTYNIGPTVPALFKAHEARYQEAQHRIRDLETKLAAMTETADGWAIRAKEAERKLAAANYVKIPGVSGAYVSTPQDADKSMEIKEDFSMRLKP